DGNLLDRSVYLALILLALYVASTRLPRSDSIFARNRTLVLLILYTLLSITWSDFPGISFKRWIRDLGVYTGVLVALLHAGPAGTFDAIVVRLSYIFVPLSVVLVKCFPALGVTFAPWTGAPQYQGASLSKNGLGGLCLISGLFLLWDIVRRWPHRRN